MELEIITLSEIRQNEKNKYGIFCLIYRVRSLEKRMTGMKNRFYMGVSTMGGGKSERRGYSGVKYFTHMHESKIMKSVKTVLRRGEKG
jgi:hypothetical protein